MRAAPGPNALLWLVGLALGVSSICHDPASGQTLRQPFAVLPGQAENVNVQVSGDVVVVYYNLVAENPQATFTVTLEASQDGGKTFDLKPTAVSGDVGAGIKPGNRVIFWRTAQDLERIALARLRFRVILAAEMTGQAENVNVVVRGGVVFVYYNLVAGNPQATFTVTLEVSQDGGKTFDLKPTAVSGDLGAGIKPGAAKQIVWEAAQEVERIALAQLRFRVILAAETKGSPPEETPGPPAIGIELRALSEAFRKKFDLPDLGGGAVVMRVLRESPASEAGLQIDDVVRKIDGRILKDFAELPEEIRKRKPGEQVRFEVWRQGRPLDVTVRLANRASMYQQACDAGDLGGCADLGSLYLEGLGIRTDALRGIALLQKACDGGAARGCSVLSQVYEKGEAVPRDDARAVVLLRQACQGSETWTCVALGLRYANGAGVEQDYARALALYQQACDAEYGYGCAYVGLLYLYGNGLYFYGKGVGKDEARAVAYFRQGCDLGAAYGCSLLGWSYYAGRGQAKDEKLGLELMQKGCSGGDTWGCEQLKKLGKR